MPDKSLPDVLLCTHDLMHIREGHPTIVRATDGREVLLQYGLAIVPDSIAQQRAVADNLPIVELDDTSWLAVARGGAAIVADAEHGRFLVRVATPDEWMDVVQAAREGEDPAHLPPMITREQAVEMTRTLPC